MPILVLTVYGAPIVWAVLLITGLRNHSFRPFLLFGVGLMLFLNIGYFVNGIPASIASFIGIYDVLINIGLAQDTNAAAISNCPDNACTFIGSMWGSFWLFRVMLFVIDPMLRNYEAAAILICIWGSAPLGIVIGDMIRRRLDQPRFVTTPAAAPPAE